MVGIQTPTVQIFFFQASSFGFIVLDDQPVSEERAALQPHAWRLPHGHRPGNQRRKNFFCNFAWLAVTLVKISNFRGFLCFGMFWHFEIWEKLHYQRVNYQTLDHQGSISQTPNSGV